MHVFHQNSIRTHTHQAGFIGGDQPAARRSSKYKLFNGNYFGAVSLSPPAIKGEKFGLPHRPHCITTMVSSAYLRRHAALPVLLSAVACVVCQDCSPANSISSPQAFGAITYDYLIVGERSPTLYAGNFVDLPMQVVEQRVLL